MVKNFAIANFAGRGFLQVPAISGSNMVTRTSAISGILDRGKVMIITSDNTFSMGKSFKKVKSIINA